MASRVHCSDVVDGICRLEQVTLEATVPLMSAAGMLTDSVVLARLRGHISGAAALRATSCAAPTVATADADRSSLGAATGSTLPAIAGGMMLASSVTSFVDSVRCHSANCPTTARSAG